MCALERDHLYDVVEFGGGLLIFEVAVFGPKCGEHLLRLVQPASFDQPPGALRHYLQARHERKHGKDLECDGEAPAHLGSAVADEAKTKFEPISYSQ
jgi:hypothetical protein